MIESEARLARFPATFSPCPYMMPTAIYRCNAITSVVNNRIFGKVVSPIGELQVVTAPLSNQNDM